MSPLLFAILVHLDKNPSLRELVYDEGCRKFFKDKRNLPLIESLGISDLSPYVNELVPYSSLYEQLSLC